MPTLTDQPFVTVIIAAVAVAIVVIVVLLVLGRVRRRQREDLYSSALEAIEALLVAPLDTTDAERADDVRTAADRARSTLTDIERASRFETSAAALALRHHVSELGQVLESRLRGEGDPYLLEVRVIELRERVRGARDRLGTAVHR